MRLQPSRPLLLTILIAVLLFAGFKFMTRPKPVPVLVTAAAPGRVEATVANTRAGSVAACRRAKLAPPAGGRIARLPVKKGQRVAAGELLLELWNDDLSARERLAREQLVTARARVVEVCQLARASGSEARQARQLRDKGFISEERVVRAEAQANSGAASCDSARAQIKEAEARIAAAHADTERTVLRAPFAGIVAEINGELGEYLTPSPPGIPTLPAVDLIDDTCLYVTAPIDEVDAARLRTGMVGRITLDAYRGHHFKGHVRRIAPYVLALEKQARTVEVEVEFDEPPRGEGGGNLLVGYSADIEVVVEARDDVLRIPTPALMPGNKVLVPKDGRLEERKLEIGLSNWEYTEVKKGLGRGEQVVTSLDREGVKAGASVTIEAPKP
ncbi:efflux transporter periplasmic adaptor subunit [Denitratisoma sp. DHT3]|uniref:efflux RND transporter periplasmic adaptor subunit n=1 Tax=Denitratisoma sp. DHT3 TaxID=1981880 RepID=UPI001198931D|nr:efflux RND transporter periplasmic adaptor subunit [Denitratisoma sp. DHT3]QDX79806.1 efflux transporter periplasmic adaptor subunit [Denitratisoma sp. DHT3]